MSEARGPVLTRHRRVILEVIQESAEHLTANEVFDFARVELPTISFATVYNSLRYLKEQGLIGELRFGMDAARYDRRLSRHDHAICSRCGKLTDLDLSVPDDLLKESERLSRYKAHSFELVLRGVCPDCTKQDHKQPTRGR